jgi:hypothetical protein
VNGELAPEPTLGAVEAEGDEDEVLGGVLQAAVARRAKTK